MGEIVSAASLAVAVLVAVAAHIFQKRRDQLNERRRIRLEYLISAYRRIEHCSNRDRWSTPAVESMETAVADVQLFGTPEQVRLALEFAQEFCQTRAGSLDPLLDCLRRELRNELLLPPVSDKRQVLRLYVGNGENPTAP